MTALLALEKLLEKQSTQGELFPNHSENYFSTYRMILQHLREQIYPRINEGLALESKNPGIFTDHGPEHFDEVVKYAGDMLGVKTGNEKFDLLSPYELYILLVAIRLHDAGNIYGRDDHEKMVFTILETEMLTKSGDDKTEKRFIADIAEAHGGRTPDGNKDTIGRLEETTTYSRIQFRPRLIAAIVRFADEICESRNRAAQFRMKQGTLPPQSEAFHYYARAITSVYVDLEGKKIRIKYYIPKEECLRTFGKENEAGIVQVYLLDEIYERLEKMNLERIYCARFMPLQIQSESIYATIDITDPDNDNKSIMQFSIKMPEDGYPPKGVSLSTTQCKEYTGELMAKKLGTPK